MEGPPQKKMRLAGVDKVDDKQDESSKVHKTSAAGSLKSIEPMSTGAGNSTLYDVLPEDHIRILTLNGTELLNHDGQAVLDIAITCQLRIVPIQDVGNGKNLYTALSYVWGSQVSSRYIVCNGVLKKVTANLYNALLHIVRSAAGTEVHMWVDAVCINQEDNDEKSQQVGLMGRIYHEASNVTVWLGSGAEMGGSGLEEFWKWLGEDGARPDRLKPAELKAGLDFLDRCDWFRRAWTFQEIVVAREAVVLCGSHSVAWEGLSDRIHSLDFEDVPQSWVSRVISDIRAARCSSDRTLIHLLCLSAGRISTDPRDRVFSLLGICNDRDCMTTDYRLSDRTVFAKTTVQAMRESKRLQFVNLINLPSIPSNKRWAGGDTIADGSDCSVFEIRPTPWIPTWSELGSDVLRPNHTADKKRPLSYTKMLMGVMQPGFELEPTSDLILSADGVVVGYISSKLNDSKPSTRSSSTAKRPYEPWKISNASMFSIPRCMQSLEVSPEQQSPRAKMNSRLQRYESAQIVRGIKLHILGKCSCKNSDIQAQFHVSMSSARLRREKSDASDNSNEEKKKQKKLLLVCWLAGDHELVILEPKRTRDYAQATSSHTASLIARIPCPDSSDRIPLRRETFSEWRDQRVRRGGAEITRFDHGLLSEFLNDMAWLYTSFRFPGN